MRYENDQIAKWDQKTLSGFYEIRAGNKDKTKRQTRTKMKTSTRTSDKHQRQTQRRQTQGVWGGYLVLRQECLVLSCLVLSCLAFSCLVLFCLVLSCPQAKTCLVLSGVTWSEHVSANVSPA
jgi:hypothetical protein